MTTNRRRTSTVLGGLAVAAACLLAGPGPAGAAVSNCAADGVQSTGALYRICMPEPSRWNGDLVIWAHGYVAFNAPPGIPEDQLCLSESFCLPAVVNLLRFGFATTSYSTHGLAVAQGIEDVIDLVQVFAAAHGQPGRVYLVGASEGGLVTALAVEQRPDLFAGGLATCGPIGDFNIQTGYFGDFRVLFDYFYPGLMPGTPLEVPPELVENWSAFFEETIKPAVLGPGGESKLAEFLKVARVPFVPGDAETVERSLHDGLWYNVFATADAIQKLGGQPYGNIGTTFRGSGDDALLNASVQRIAAEPSALAEIDARYQTTGRISRPLVTLHTLKDQQVPYRHEILYRRKVVDADSGALHVGVPIFRYEHCNVTPLEALLGFAIVVSKASQQPLAGVEEVLADPLQRADFERLSAAYGAPQSGRTAPAPDARLPLRAAQ